MIRNQIGLAIALPHLGHCLGADIMGAIKLNIVSITRRQSSDLIDNVHQHLGAMRWQPFSGHRIFCKDLLSSVGGFHQRHRIGYLDANSSSYNDRFQMLGSHHRTHTGSASRAVHIIHNGSVQRSVFPSQTDRRNAHIGISASIPQGGLRLPDRFPP